MLIWVNLGVFLADRSVDLTAGFLRDVLADSVFSQKEWQECVVLVKIASSVEIRAEDLDWATW